MQRLRTSIPLLALGLAAASACSRTDDIDGPGKTDAGPTPMGGDCPGDVLGVCDLKLEGGPRQPLVDDPIELSGVVVTTPTVSVSVNMMGEVTLAGFYVQDPNTNDVLNGQYSGLSVVYDPRSLTSRVPGVGSLVNIEGTYQQFSRDGAKAQHQVRAMFVEAAGGTATITPIEVANPALIATGGAQAEAYEGVLVRVANVTTSRINPPGSNGNTIFGWEVDGSLIIATSYVRYFTVESEPFASITGVLRLGTSPFDAGIHTLAPRRADDIVSNDPVPIVDSVVVLQDATNANHPPVCTSMGQGVTGRCPQVRFSNLVVTAVDGYVSANLRALWVQDPTVADGRFAGVKVVYSRDLTGLPSEGDVVDVTGEAIEFFRAMQIQNATVTRKGTTMAPPVITVPAASIARNEAPETNPYEGVLVRIENVTVVGCDDMNRSNRDFGAWTVSGNVYVGTAFNYAFNGDFPMNMPTCDNQPNGNCSCSARLRANDMRTAGTMLTAIVGVTDFGFDDFRLQPRGDRDIIQ